MNMFLYIIIGVSLLFIVWIFYADIRKGIRRKKILKESFPDQFVEILERQLPFYSRLADDMKTMPVRSNRSPREIKQILSDLHKNLP
ncbi:MAG: hypothetical protein CVV42_17530 [Candidatus Riflebacteria bacterium HGW-Riflebacteria-2]|jgi:hypothetical protein|nr:MAG: hypothetical protein CVV42_17530 [Candidatus Riflebacteria bacterium HGW-Riflebacteria-2]